MSLAAYYYTVNQWCLCGEWEERWPVWMPQCRGENPVGHAPGMGQDIPEPSGRTLLSL